MSARLDLLIPGLLGPLPPAARSWDALGRPGGALALILSRGRPSRPRQPDYLALLGTLFPDAPTPLPAAALGWAGEGGDPGASHWLRADPVHLRADRDRVMLFGGPYLDLDDEEAAQLAADCNRLLAEDGLELALRAPNRGYLRLPAPTDLQALPLPAIIGRYLDDSRPGGADARRWQGLTTELQMVLHASSVNDARERRGRLPVNGLWLWGPGPMPRIGGGGRVYADEPILAGLGKAAGAEVAPVPAEFAAVELAESTLVGLGRAGDALLLNELNDWLSAVEALERDWLGPALAALKAGRLTSLTVTTEAGAWTLDPAGLRRFWRRPGPLSRYLEF